MKKLICLITALGLAISVNVVAAPKPDKKAPAQRVSIYSQPSTRSKIIEKVSPNADLVEIFKKNQDWVKVGNPTNGNVGWINEKQYRQAWEAFNKPDIRTVYVQYTKADKNGKPQVNIIAYQNGEKVSDKEAKKLYQQIKKQNFAEQKKMQQFFQNFGNFSGFPPHQWFNNNFLPFC